ncbi:MAG: OB-fold nucleic acid binding domain-containing protein, partial [Chitinophagales bacterium]
THNQSSIDKLGFFMDECRHMDIPVLGPDINESLLNFSVNKEGQIRFGLAAIKGVGEAAVNALIEERKKNGPYKNLFDLVRRINLRSVNKKTIEALVLAGACDCFRTPRSAYFEMVNGESQSLIETAIKYGNSYQAGGANEQPTLFGEMVSIQISEPQIPEVPEWNLVEKLKKEYEVCGMYLSGHPLDDHRFEIEAMRTCSIKDIPKHLDQQVTVIGLVSGCQTRVTKGGDRFILFQMEDFSDTVEIALFKEHYVKFKHYVEEPGYILCVKGMVKLSYRDREKMEVKVSDIMLLSEVRAKHKLKLMLRLPLNFINAEFIEEMATLLKTHPGKDHLLVQVTNDAYDLHFRSANGTVTINRQLVNALEKMGEIKIAVM